MTPGTAPPSVTLYGHWSCPFVHRVAWALATRGIDHDTVKVPPSAMRPADFVVPSEFVEHSPRREIPMLRIGDEYLADSIPILEWLDASIGGGERLLPEEPVSAARVRSRVAWIDVEVFRPMIGVYYGTDPDRIAAASEALSAALVEVAAWLDDAPWLAGPRPTPPSFRSSCVSTCCVPWASPTACPSRSWPTQHVWRRRPGGRPHASSDTRWKSTVGQPRRRSMVA